MYCSTFFIFIQIVDLLVFEFVFLITLYDIILKLALSFIILKIFNIIMIQYYLNFIIWIACILYLRYVLKIDKCLIWAQGDYGFEYVK